MKLYRFSPIKSKEKLFRAIEYTHFACYELCKNSFGRYFPNAGNIGIFCHYDEEYEFLTGVRKELTETSDNFLQKYFKLYESIAIPAKGDVPQTTYTYLYIRKPDPYRAQVGDVDFYLEPEEYKKTKESVGQGKIPGARVFDRTDLDMVELFDPDVDALAFLATHKMAQTVRVKQSDATNL